MYLLYELITYQIFYNIVFSIKYIFQIKHFEHLRVMNF